jgi:hypothetical protein
MEITLAHQVWSFVGALLILVAYVGHQLKFMNARMPAYKILNAAGSAVLAYVAFRPFQIGFVILEVVWALVSIYALVWPTAKTE